MADTKNTIISTIKLRNDTSANWETAKDSAVLTQGEAGLEYTTDGKVKLKFGQTDENGNAKKWSELDYFESSKPANFYEAILQANEMDEDAIERVTTGKELQQGDIAVVKSPIAGNSYSYTSYVYRKVVDAEGNESFVWAATDGNYSATNVYFKEDLMTTTAIGNITLTAGQATISAAGQNLVDVFNTIFVKETNTNLTNGAITAKLSDTNTTYYEIGTTGTKNVTVQFNNQGKYDYGRVNLDKEATLVAAGTVLSNGDAAPADGITTGSNVDAQVTATAYSMKMDNSTANVAQSGNTGTFTLSPAAKNEKGSCSIVGTITHSQGAIPLSNLKKAYPTQRYAASSVSTSAATAFKWYVPYFKGFKYSDNAIAAPASITAAQLATLSKVTNGTAYDQTKTTTDTATKAWRQYFLAYPKSWFGSYVMTAAKDGNGIDCTVNEANEVTMNINGNNIVYRVFYINNGADYDTLTIKWEHKS